MSATIMQALDTTIAKCGAAYMQGSLSASLDQINWVLTSYIVASAIMTAPSAGWRTGSGASGCSSSCAAGFTFASVLCGLAQNYRADGRVPAASGSIRRSAGAAVAVGLLDATPPRSGFSHGDLGHGVMLGPIMGPTLGAWLTENYSWHWVFFINLPIGILTVGRLMIFMAETARNSERRFDWFGLPRSPSRSARCR
jgi:DHA2 family multidrug resistance protein